MGALTPCPVPGLIVLGDIDVLYNTHLHVGNFGCTGKDLFLACIFNPLESMLAEDAKKSPWCSLMPLSSLLTIFTEISKQIHVG